MASSVPPESSPSTAEQMPAPSAAPPEANTIQPSTPDPTITMPASSSSPQLSPTSPPSNPVTPPPITAAPPAPAVAENSPPLPNIPSPSTIPSVPPPVDIAPPPATTFAVENPPATLPPPPQTPPPTSPPKPSATPLPIPSPAATLPQPPVLNSTSPVGPTNSTWKPVGPGQSPAGPEVAPGPINWGIVGGGGIGGGGSAGGHVSSGLIIGIGVVAVFVVLGLVLLYLCLAGRRKNEEEDKNSPTKTDSSANQEFNHNDVEKGDPAIINFNLPKSRSQKHGKFEFNNNPWTPGAHHLPSSCKGSFSYEELVRATKGFSEANLLGEGGFGYVHKGMLPNGTEIVVKQLKTGSHQGELEFQAELDIISRVHHRHLVTLLGYCTSGAATFLVYEFVPNNTLEFHLHGEGQPIMDWATRMKIAIGSAKGLAYLHEDCCPSIIHRGIKAANILLDYNFQPKVSDFGLAEFFSNTKNPITHVSTRVVGTFGYLAPEYASSGRLIEKSDVYSFGVMLLELITGCPSIKQINELVNEALVDWAQPLLRQGIETGDVDALIDARLLANYNPGQTESMISCAAACTRRAAWLRPRMSQIVRALERSEPLIDLYVETKPSQSKLYNSLEKKKLAMALASPEHCRSQRSDSTSEYGLNHSISSSEA